MKGSCVRMAQILSVRKFSALASECPTKQLLGARLRLLLESGGTCELRDDQLDQVWSLIRDEGHLDTDWLKCSVDEVYFVSRGGAKLLLQVNPPPQEQETLHLLLDQSGSMASMQMAAYDGARELIEALPDDALVVFTTFATTVSLGHPVSKRSALELFSQPRVASGSTCLYDAAVSALQESMMTGRVTVVIVTDGTDTSSRLYTQSDVRNALVTFQRDPLHKVLFLGSHQDALMSATAIGIPVDRALTFGSGERGMRGAFRAASSNVARYRVGEDVGFLEAERQASV